MFGAIKRAFRPLDTSVVDAAICAAEAAHTRTRACARALRMDVSCGDASSAVARVVGRLGTGIERKLRELNRPIVGDDDDMQELLRKI